MSGYRLGFYAFGLRLFGLRAWRVWPLGSTYPLTALRGLNTGEVSVSALEGRVWGENLPKPCDVVPFR